MEPKLDAGGWRAVENCGIELQEDLPESHTVSQKDHATKTRLKGGPRA